MQVHNAKVTGPFVARDTFVVQFDVDVTDKTSNKRMQMSEVGITQLKTAKSRAKNFCRSRREKSSVERHSSTVVLERADMSAL